MRYIIKPLFKLLIAILLTIYWTGIEIIMLVFYILWYFKFPNKQHFIHEFKRNYLWNREYSPFVDFDDYEQGEEWIFETYYHFIWNVGGKTKFKLL